MQISDQDKILAAISYPIGLVALVILLVEDLRVKPYLKYHAVQSLAVSVIIVVLSLTGILSCISLVLWLVTFYWAFKAFQGEYFEIPGLTNFLKGQDWI